MKSSVLDPTRKPPETYTLIENFCLGLRRLEVFGRRHSLRPGWVTVGESLDQDLDPTVGAVRWNREQWDGHITSIRDGNGRHVVPTTPGTQESNIDIFKLSSQVLDETHFSF